MSEDERDGGRFTKRPEGAAPLFDSKRGKQMALKRWEEKEARNRAALIRFASEELGYEVDYNQALEYAIMHPQFKAALAGKTAAAKIVLQLIGEMPEHADAKIVHDNRQVNFMNVRLTPPQARAYIEDQRAQGNAELADIVESGIDFEADEDVIQVIPIPVDDSN